MTDNERIQNEKDKIYMALISGDLTPEQSGQMYAAQQALAWALDENAAKSPFAMIMKEPSATGESLPITDTLSMPADC